MKVQFFFDYLSPYAYLAWQRLPQLIEAEIVATPVLLAGLLNHHQTRGPAEIPPKRLYTFRHVVRLAHDYGCTLNPPASHPFNPLLALRLTCLPMTEQERAALVSRVFKATWVDGVDVSDPQAMQAHFPELDFEAALSPENKARLRKQTESAIEAGVFGVPTMVVDSELFFGCDSMLHLQRALSGEDPLSEDHVQRWGGIRASANRT